MRNTGCQVWIIAEVEHQLFMGQCGMKQAQISTSCWGTVLCCCASMLTDTLQ